MKKKAFNKICACVLMVSLIIGLIPNAVKAEGVSSGTSDTEEVNNVTNEFGETILTEKPKVLCELVEEREEKVKHFLMSNHSVQVVMYSEPVHYIEDGEWKDIDSTLTFEEAQHPEDFAGYINKQGDFSVKIAENSSEDKLVQIVNKDYNLGFQLVSEEIDSGENISGEKVSGENVSDETAEALQEDEEDNTISDGNKLIEENTVNTETITEIDSNQTTEDNTEIDSQTDIIPGVTEIPRDTSVVAEIKQKQETDYSKFFESNNIKYDQAFEVNTVSDTVVYNGITDNKSTDIEYKVTGLGLKENIIVNEKQEAYRYTFNLSTDNLEVKLEDNQVTASDPKTGEVIYIIPAPFMYDAENDFSNDVTYSLEKVDSGYQLIVEADEKWINSKERVLPVTIDPIITTKTAQNAIKSTFISSKKANENFYEYKMLLAGVDSYAYNKCRTLIKFQLPELNPGDIIVDAKLNLNQYGVEAYASNTPNMAVNAYRITSSWNEKSVTWSSMPSVDYNEIDYSFISRSDGNTLKTKIFDITQAAKEWYDGDRVNYGIMLRTNNEETKDTVDSIYAKYWSEKYNEVTEAYPMILLEYRNTKGLEAYYSYTELSAGTAGTAFVSNYTGNLVFTQNSISTSGLKIPASVYFVYNTNNAHTNTNNTVQETGYGWKLNIQQYVVSSQKFGLSGDAYAEYPYVYVDEDGTEHYIKKVVNGSKTTYEDEDGLGLTLVKNSDGTYKLTDSQDNVMNFTSYGNIKSIQDANGNTMTINYTSGIITSVTDGAGRKITINNSNNQISSIKDAAGRTTNYTFEEGILKNVTNPDGTSNSYTYDGDNALKAAAGFDGYELNFAYLSKAKGKRIFKAAEYAKDGAGNKIAGQKVGFDYSVYNTTKIDSSGVDNIYGNGDDMITTNQFDNYGRLVSSQSMASGEQLGSSLTGYTNTTNIKQINKVTSAADMGKNINNLLLNHNVESTDKWTLLKTGTSTETVGNSTFHHYMGAKSLKIGVENVTNGSNVRYRQILSNSIVVPGKTYTFSGYMKTVGLNPLVSGKEGAFLMVTCTLADGTYESYYSNYLSTTTDTQINNGWRRESIAFTAPASTVSTSVNLVLKQANGNVYFDALQLEEGETANAYNFLENPSLENTDTLYGFSSSGLDGNDITAGQTVFDGKKAFKIQGDKTKLKQLSQEVAVSGTEEDTYIISGWAKAYAVPAFVADNSSSVNRRFKISVKITYTDGSEIYKSAAEFNPDVTDWQYGAVTINLSDNNAATNKTPAKLTIYPRYDSQANSVFFDNFSVIKGEVLNYTYDNNGNLSSASSSPAQTNTFDHDDKNNLTKETDANNNSDLHEYDSKHNLIKTTSDRGVVYKYTYNDSGNITGLSQQNKDTSPTMQIQTDTVYTEDGAYVSEESDQDGYTTKYTYHGNKGLLTSVTDGKENTTNYTYNDMNDLLTKVSAAVGEATITNAYEYNKNVLTKIIHNGFSYNFLYDEFGNNTAIKVGDSALASYEYKGVNGDLKKVTYGNGATNSYTYDVYGNISQVAVNGTARFKWYADNTGRITRHEDISNQLLHHYEYDLTGRLLRQGVEDMSKPANTQRTAYLTEFSYDDNNNLTKLVNQAGAKTQINGYGYTLDDLPSTYTMPTGKTVTNSYDSLNRLNQYTIDTTVPIVGEYLYSTSMRNQTGQSKYRTTKVYQETVGNTGIRYSYDKLGNIIAINEKQANGDYTLSNSYEYDELNQLTREYDAKQNISKVYTYDLGGNIIDIKEYNSQNTTPENLRNTVTYEYADANWKDKLTSYNGQVITYDTIGNPINYKGYTLGWDNGRELASLSGNGITASYSYDADGLRTTKTVNGIKTTYQYLDGQLLYEKKGNTQLHYFYDVNGVIKGIQTNAGSGEVTNYYVITNTRGDVTQIYDEAGSLQVVYAYDSWGKLLSIKDGSGNEITDDNNVGRLNSLRYRSYYYDEETGVYYLQSRYYDPGTCRFINTDDLNILDIEVDSMLHYNLYAYCWNNPVNMADGDGYLPWFVAAAVGGALFDTVAYLVSSAISGQKVTWAGVGKSALRGAITGVAFGALGKGVKALTTTAKATKAAKYTTGTANQVGKIGEKLAKITKNTRRYNVGGRIRIPDGMTKKFVQEVKNVKSLSLTSQLKDSMTLANSMGKRLELFIRPNTYLSGPLKRAIKSNGVKITYLW